MKYRVREEVYENGNSKFFPEGKVEDKWTCLSYKSFGFNQNGLDWCESLIESTNLISKFKSSLSKSFDNLIEEKIHDVE